MTSALTISAAALLGLVASAHCLAMCGGITTALGLSARASSGRMRALILAAYQAGRITSYAVLGLLLASALGAVVALLDLESVRRSLRILSGLMLLLAACVALGYWRDPGHALGRRIWSRIAPLARRALPVTTIRRAFAFGMVWGWMPCGFVYTVLLMATLQHDALQGALTMIAFGLGTAPALLIASFGSQRLASRTGGSGTRRIVGSVLLICALATVTGPWIVQAIPGLHDWLPHH